MQLEIRLFKQLEVVINGMVIDSSKWRGSTPRSLMQFLAISRGFYATTDEIIETFWGDVPAENARTSLQVAVSRLRSVLKSHVQGESGDGLIHFTGTGYRLPENTRVDLWDLQQQARDLRKLAAQDPAAALSSLDGMLLPDPKDLLPEHPFTDWATAARKQAHDDVIALCMLRAELRVHSRRRREALEDLLHILAMDPAREAVAQLAMRLAADLGDRPAALEIFHRCRTALAEELGLDPSPDLVALHTQILREDVAVASMKGERSSTPPSGGKKAQATNLPSQLTSFVGREEDLAEVSALFLPEEDGRAPHRLVTLTGPGGSGKTRLALETGKHLLGSFPDGVWLVELAELRDGTLLAETLAAAFDLQGAPGQPALDVVCTYLETRQLLLILDNCEHLAEGCAKLVERLLHACPHLQILATSRQSLGLGGEVIWSVSPLPIPDPRTTRSVEEFQRSPAVRLFADRARSVFPRFEITEENAPHIAYICRCLDGMPLALELAAARVRLLPVREVSERLRDRFKLLTHGASSAATRHQTLRSTLDWSYELLTTEERTLLRRLSVFAGSFSLEAAEAICPGQDLDGDRVLDLLHDLVDKSLVVAHLESFPARFKLLETIREYAADRLEQAGETVAVWNRSMLWWKDLATSAAPRMLTGDQITWYDKLEAELDNLRVTLDWADRSGSTMAGLEIALGLWRFWMVRNHYTEGTRWLELFTAKVRTNASPQLMARVLSLHASICVSYGQVPRGLELVSEAYAFAQAAEDPFLQAQAIGIRGMAAMFLGDIPAAVEQLHTSQAIADSIGDEWMSGQCSLWLGVIPWMLQDPASAEAHLKRAYDLYVKGQDLWILALVASFLARVAADLGDIARARTLLRETISLYMRLRDKRLLACALVHLATVELNTGNPAEALRLFGLVDALIERNGATVATWVDWVAWVSVQYHQGIARCKAALTPEGYREAYEAGAAWSPEELLAGHEM